MCNCPAINFETILLRKTHVKTIDRVLATSPLYAAKWHVPYLQWPTEIIRMTHAMLHSLNVRLQSLNMKMSRNSRNWCASYFLDHPDSHNFDTIHLLSFIAYCNILHKTKTSITCLTCLLPQETKSQSKIPHTYSVIVTLSFLMDSILVLCKM